MTERFRIESEPSPDGRGFVGKFVPDPNGPFQTLDMKRFMKTEDLKEAVELMARAIDKIILEDAKNYGQMDTKCDSEARCPDSDGES